ncbi:MAG: response regulator [Anaerolineae bacterium]|jgi:DNA-binding NarL/FixJ family response regulator|nr:response regulator [Anaerolineae bacterium]
MRILIADGDLRVRAALHVLLTEEDEEAVVAECADLEGLVRQLQEFAPELVLLDWELPGRPAAAFLLARHETGARPKLIVLSTRLETRAAALAIGADDFVHKADPPEAVLQACRRVLDAGASVNELDAETTGL